MLDTNCSGDSDILSFLLKSPVALLKSGIPDSVETPAPPKNTILLLSFKIWISFSILVLMKSSPLFMYRNNDNLII